MLQMGGCSYNAFPDNGRLLHQSRIHIINIIVNVIISNIIHLPYMVIDIVDHWFSSKQHMKIDVQCLAMTNNHCNDNCPIARKGWKWLALQQHCVLQCIAMTNNSITLMTKTMQGWNIPPLLAQNTRTVTSWTNTATSSIPSSFAFAIILGV